MAVRLRPEIIVGGGLRKWVPPADAREIAREIAGLRTPRDVWDWCRSFDNRWDVCHAAYFTAAGRAGLAGEDRAVTKAERAELTSFVVAAVADHRRERSLPPGASLRCATCNAPLEGGFYCDDHELERDLEIAVLTTTRRRKVAA